MASQRRLINICLIICVLISSSINGMPVDNQEDDGLRHLLKRSPYSERDLANRLLNRLMDVAYDTFREMGVSAEELQQVQHKRSKITACYFQAVTCY